MVRCSSLKSKIFQIVPRQKSTKKRFKHQEDLVKTPYSWPWTTKSSEDRESGVQEAEATKKN